MGKLDSNTRAMFRTAFDLRERYDGMDNNEANWNRLTLDVLAASNKHGNHPLVMGLLIAVYEDIGRQVFGEREASA